MMETDLYILKLRKSKLENAIHRAESQARECIHGNNVSCFCRLRVQLLQAELQACNASIDQETRRLSG